MDIAAIALQGLQQAQAQVEGAAQRLSGAGRDSPEGAPIDVADLSAEAVALISAKSQFAANVNVLKIANNMRQVVDLLG